MNATDIVLTAEVARMAGVVPATVRWWERTGQLPAQRTSSGTRLYLRADVERLVRERERQKACAQAVA